VDADLDRHRRQWIALARRDSGEHLLHGDVENLRERTELCEAGVPRLRQVGRPQLDGRSVDVVHKHVSVAVENRRARGIDTQRAQLVVPRGAQVLVPCEDLQRPEAQEERAEDEQRDAAEHRDPQRGLRRQAVRLLDARVVREEGRASQAAAPLPRGRATRAGAAAS
jgi:hypothetical protein